jgi:hypothetical protein
MFCKCCGEKLELLEMNPEEGIKFYRCDECNEQFIEDMDAQDYRDYEIERNISLREEKF